MAKRLTEERYKEIKRYYTTHKYQRSFTIVELAEKYGVSRMTAYKIINSRGFANYKNKHCLGASKVVKQEEPTLEVKEEKKPTLLDKIRGFFSK